MDSGVLQKGLHLILEETKWSHLGARYRGKVRDNYTKNGERIIVSTDRVSAFDRVIGTLPFKGQVLNSLSSWWFKQTENVAPNHLIDVPDPNVTRAHECTPLRVEMIVRAYLTGVTSTSIWTAYQRGEREFCGHRLPDGLRVHERLPEPILTPSTKAADGDHDVSVSRKQLLDMGHVTASEFDEAAEYAHALFLYGQTLCRERGLILVDTKYEFGKTKSGRIVVIDEIHTPDSSRFWFSDSYTSKFDSGDAPVSFDKEYVRRWLKSQGYEGEGKSPSLPDEVRLEAASRYAEACETIRGEAFVPNLEPPLERLEKNLQKL